MANRDIENTNLHAVEVRQQCSNTVKYRNILQEYVNRTGGNLTVAVRELLTDASKARNNRALTPEENEMIEALMERIGLKDSAQVELYLRNMDWNLEDAVQALLKDSLMTGVTKISNGKETSCMKQFQELTGIWDPNVTRVYLKQANWNVTAAVRQVGLEFLLRCLAGSTTSGPQGAPAMPDFIAAKYEHNHPRSRHLSAICVENAEITPIQTDCDKGFDSKIEDVRDVSHACNFHPVPEPEIVLPNSETASLNQETILPVLFNWLPRVISAPRQEIAPANPRKVPEDLITPDTKDELTGTIEFGRNFVTRYRSHSPIFFAGTLEKAYCLATTWKLGAPKLLAIYLHDKNAPGGDLFCREVLCSKEVAKLFVDHTIFWGWDLTHPSNKLMAIAALKRIFKTGFPTVFQNIEQDGYSGLFIMTCNEAIAKVAVFRVVAQLDMVLSKLDEIQAWSSGDSVVPQTQQGQRPKRIKTVVAFMKNLMKKC